MRTTKRLDGPFESPSEYFVAYANHYDDHHIDNDVIRRATEHLGGDTPIEYTSNDLTPRGAYVECADSLIEQIKAAGYIKYAGRWWLFNHFNIPVASIIISEHPYDGWAVFYIGPAHGLEFIHAWFMENLKTSDVGLGEKETTDLPAYTISSMGMFGPEIDETPVTTVREAKPEYYPYIEGGMVELIRRFMASDSNVLILFGTPGTGKTSAVTAAARVLNLLPIYATSTQVIAHKSFVRTVFGIHDRFTKAKAAPDTRKAERKALFKRPINRIAEMREEYAAFALPPTPEKPRPQPVAVVEDADMLLRPRELDNHQMAELLNMTDGATGNKDRKVIFTTNLSGPEAFDPALLRPGRCFAVINCRNLTPEEAVVARQASGKTPIEFLPEGEMSLAEVLSDGKETGTITATPEMRQRFMAMQRSGTTGILDFLSGRPVMGALTADLQHPGGSGETHE